MLGQDQDSNLKHQIWRMSLSHHHAFNLFPSHWVVQTKYLLMKYAISGNVKTYGMIAGFPIPEITKA